MNFYVLSDQFKDFQAFYEAAVSARKARGVPAEEFSYKEPPEATKAVFKYMRGWNCREETIKQEHNLLGLSCITVNESSLVQISFHGEGEKEVLDKASLLRDIMLSLKIDRSTRP